MASIYKRGRTWWIHSLVAGKSVSRSLRTTDERVAREKKKQLEAMEVTGQLAKPSKTPIEPFLQSFCEYLMATCTRKGGQRVALAVDAAGRAQALQDEHGRRGDCVDGDTG